MEPSPISKNHETPTPHCDVTSWACPTSCGLASAWTWSLKAIKGQPEPSWSRPQARGAQGTAPPRALQAGSRRQEASGCRRAGRPSLADHRKPQGENNHGRPHPKHRSAPRRVRRRPPSFSEEPAKGACGPALSAPGTSQPQGGQLGAMPTQGCSRDTHRGRCFPLCSGPMHPEQGREEQSSTPHPSPLPPPLSCDRCSPGPCGFQHPAGGLLSDASAAPPLVSSLQSALCFLGPQQASRGGHHVSPRTWHALMGGVGRCLRVEPFRGAAMEPYPPIPPSALEERPINPQSSHLLSHTSGRTQLNLLLYGSMTITGSHLLSEEN